MLLTSSSLEPGLLAHVERAVDRVVDRARARVRLELDQELVRAFQVLAERRRARVASLNAFRKPRSPSKIVSAPVKPSCAMRAEVTPLRAAGPGLKRFCIDGPYISISPEACAPASPSAEAILSFESFSSFRRRDRRAEDAARRRRVIAAVAQRRVRRLARALHHLAAGGERRRGAACRSRPRTPPPRAPPRTPAG